MGYVVQLTDTTDLKSEQIKPVLGCSDGEVSAEGRMVALAAWLKERYGCTMLQALRTVIPVRQKVKPKENRILVLRDENGQAQGALELFTKKNQKARARLLKALLEENEIPMKVAADKLNITARTVHELEERGLLTLRSEQTWRNPVGGVENIPGSIRLSSGQQAAVDRVVSEWDDPDACGRYLLHGVTGSGKTEVYLELISCALRRGEQAIVLIPEIALTYQTVMRFYKRFGDRISIVNSRLSAGEKYDQFERARRGEIDVMIGPRSALFTPFPNLGIIVIDEEHETAYRSEMSPRYHAREVAFYRAEREHAKVILGSATPSLTSYYLCEKGRMTKLTLTERAGGAVLPDVSIVDMRRELREGNRSILSRRLQEKMDETLENGQQVMLFLNRRGYAGFVSCRECGHVIRCPHCDVSLTLHTGRRLKCHYCGYETGAPEACPECGSGHLGIFKAGTQQIEQELTRKFEGRKVLRMDLDTTRDRESYARILSAFAHHEADILIGTQMIVKGHDFPDVTLVGVLAADLSLNVPDFAGAERTFCLLTQAAGRAGRRLRKGNVVIQTYEPEHYSITCAASQDYESFYEQEMSYRFLASYPPVGALLAIHLAGEDERLLDVACDYLKRFLTLVAGKKDIEILGPAGETIGKIQDVYRKILYLKGPDQRQLIEIRKKCEQYIEINDGFSALRISYELFD